MRVRSEEAASAPAPPRGDVARAIRARDPATLQWVAETYLSQILREARGAGLHPTEAEEVTQETFTTFFEIAPRFEGRSHVRTFLFGILYRKIAEARRDRAKERRHDPIDDVIEARFSPDGSWSRPPVAADRLLRTRELRRYLADCLGESPANQRMAFHLREVEGLSTSEICKILGVTATNLGVMLYRLRNRTRECLESRETGA